MSEWAGRIEQLEEERDQLATALQAETERANRLELRRLIDCAKRGDATEPVARNIEALFATASDKRVEKLEAALGRAADDLGKAANQFESLALAGKPPERNHLIFAEKELQARSILRGDSE